MAANSGRPPARSSNKQVTSDASSGVKNTLPNLQQNTAKKSTQEVKQSQGDVVKKVKQHKLQRNLLTALVVILLIIIIILIALIVRKQMAGNVIDVPMAHTKYNLYRSNVQSKGDKSYLELTNLYTSKQIYKDEYVFRYSLSLETTSLDAAKRLNAKNKELSAGIQEFVKTLDFERDLKTPQARELAKEKIKGYLNIVLCSDKPKNDCKFEIKDVYFTDYVYSY